VVSSQQGLSRIRTMELRAAPIPDNAELCELEFGIVSMISDATGQGTYQCFYVAKDCFVLKNNLLVKEKIVADLTERQSEDSDSDIDDDDPFRTLSLGAGGSTCCCMGSTISLASRDGGEELFRR
jgi:hypothetical protein